MCSCACESERLDMGTNPNQMWMSLDIITEDCESLRCPTALQGRFARIERVPLRRPYVSPCELRKHRGCVPKLAGMLGQRPLHIRDEATHHGFVERVVKKEHAGLVGNILCRRISLFNADGGRVVAATAILGHPDQDPSGALEPDRLIGVFVRSDIVAGALRTRIAIEVVLGGTCTGSTVVDCGRSCLLVIIP
jgi:hypothetical protein